IADVLAAPVAHLCFTEEVELASANRRDLTVDVLVQLVDDPVEIERAASHRNARAPVVRIAIVSSVAPRRRATDEVRSSRDRGLELQLVELDFGTIGTLTPLRRKDRQTAGYEGQIAPSSLELE